MIIQTDLPVLDPIGDKVFQAQPRQVKKWLKSLQQIDMWAFNQKLLDGIDHLNRQPCSAKHRLEIMELLQPQACKAIMDQHRNLVSQNLPLSKKAASGYQQARAILNGMAIGYKIIVQQNARGESRLDHKKTLKSIHHAMFLMSEDYLISSLVYESATKNLWKDMFQLYNYAERLEMTHTPVKESTLGDTDRHTIHQMLMHICLLSLIEPYTLRHGEVNRVSAFFEGTAACVQCHKDPAAAILNNNIYSIYLSENNPPRLSRTEDTGSSPNHRYLGLNNLLQRLDTEIQKGEQDDRQLIAHRAHLSLDLLLRIKQKLTVNPNRQYERMPAKSRADAVTGLNAISENLRGTLLLADENKPENIFIKELNLSLQAAAYDTENLPEEEDPYEIKQNFQAEYIDELEMVKFEGIQTIITESISPLKEEDIQRMIVEEPEFGARWDVVDISAGGYRLAWKNSQRCKAQVSELIALRHVSNKASNWHIGVIRWMQCHGTRGLETGIQLLAKRVVSATVHRLNSSSYVSQDGINALVLPDTNSNASRSSLLLPRNSHKVGNKLLLEIVESEFEIELSECQEIAGTYSRFNFIATGKH